MVDFLIPNLRGVVLLFSLVLAGLVAVLVPVGSGRLLAVR